MGHLNELIDFTVAVYIINKKRVLLVDHKQLKTWLPVGGHIELDEDPDQALLREIKEECGLKVKLLGTPLTLKSPGTKFLRTPQFMDIHKINETHRHVGMIYFATSNTDKVKLAEKEHNGIGWFGEKDIKKMKLKPAVRFYSLEALRIAGSHA